ncbi:hypothetical protein J3R30DRAFT_3400721 [Lentinula aciculospora]|uniref:GDS1 winged helix domain-containing protein n=1 Tax=Lentinula aciculospora TaxID=153920 RepID=A0A9W9DX08_9AGAR|nr:hypothetical protein J3R30DRAFT_3400721 [Lentinula aciculospora]
MDPQHIVTRTRTIKPSVRLRQSPDPSKTRSTTSDYPVFPLPHVALHPDDSASKVLLAIGRSFMSIDNKAMTIKDLSEMAMTMGYNCQNVSAASQAITTYIRAHLQRCETQQDQPLLLKHVLSGTPADDNLLPALHSKCGGASTSTDSRATNFRRGTVVWYLSRSTGAPCPFARAGIRLCDYVDLSASHTTSKNRVESQQCGQKRKRRSTRECVLKNSVLSEPTRSLSSLSAVADSEDDSDNSDVSSDNDEPLPVKVKLTLRLPPLTRVRKEAALAQSSLDVPGPYRRSPSVPFSVASVASPPPDSENEEEDSSGDDDDDDEDDFPSKGKEIDISMDVDDSREDLLLEDHDEDEAQFSDEWDDDNDEDLSTTWESPGPRSPSAQPSAFIVKEEPRDVQGLLDQWEFNLDVKDSFVQLEESSQPIWNWDWESSYHNYTAPSPSPSNNSSASMSSPTQSRIKEEDFDLSLSGPAFTDWRQSATLSPTTPFGFSFGEESDMFPMSPGAFPVSPISPLSDYTTLRPRARTVPSLAPGGFLLGQAFETPSRPSDPRIAHDLSSLVHSLTMDSPTITRPPRPVSGSNVFGTVPSESERNKNSMTKEQAPPCVSPNDIRITLNGTDSVVVNTCEPCQPQIVATHIDGIAVYQSSLGPYTLLRRIDTDFVNLTPIIKFAQTPQPMTAIPGATTVMKGRQEVQGLWVPLEAMRLYVQDCITCRPPTSPDPVVILDIFLSDSLVERFPTALREFVQTTRGNLTSGLLGRHFGKSFGGDSDSSSPSSAGTPNPTAMAAAAAAAKGRVPIEIPSPSSLPFGVPVALTPPAEVPLSATEEKIFAEFCVNLEWEKDEQGDGNVMDIEDALRTALPLTRTPERLTRTRSRVRPVSTSPPSSPLSSCPPSPMLDKAQLHALTSSKSLSATASQVDATLPSLSSSSLRRSKRVADALAAKSNVKTRSSNRRSRNLS